VRRTLRQVKRAIVSELRPQARDGAWRGYGDVEVHATEALAVTCFGSGNVRYCGEPKLTIRGDASVERME